MASLIPSGSSEQLAFHLGKARENRLSDKELITTVTHLTLYAGWPKAMSAPTVATDACKENDHEDHPVSGDSQASGGDVHRGCMGGCDLPR
ncbi:carboxymuconolactone decarboxylase family protein [Streptomyces variegatus]|uniref:carboxymuconolactone decarboxylase family protein n=1 Tax=Streptomyces variegatus TaxID=284040 RepID=UPI003C2E1D9A